MVLVMLCAMGYINDRTFLHSDAPSVNEIRSPPEEEHEDGITLSTRIPLGLRFSSITVVRALCIFNSPERLYGHFGEAYNLSQN